MSWPAVAFLTVVVIFGYVLVFMLLLSLFNWMFDTIQKGTVKQQLVLLIPFIVLGIVCFVLDLIHTIMFFWAGYSMLTGVRNWWHKGAPR